MERNNTYGTTDGLHIILITTRNRKKAFLISCLKNATILY